MNERVIRVVDENEITRMCLSSELPNPMVDGVERSRDVRVSGIQLNDENGNEIGGFGCIEGMRAGLLAIDYSSHEAITLFAAETPDGHATALRLNERVHVDGETGPERDPSRIDLRVENGLPSLVFKGKDGKNRIVIGLDENDNPIIEIIDKDGNKKSLII